MAPWWDRLRTPPVLPFLLHVLTPGRVFVSMKILLLPLLLAELLAAQQPKTFHIEYVLKEEASGKPTSERHYSVVAESGFRSRLHSGPKVPYYSAGPNDKQQLHMAQLGNLLDCVAREAGEQVKIDCEMELSAVAASQPGGNRPVGFPPVITTNRATFNGTLQLDKQSLVSALEDPESRRRVEIFITVRRFGN